MNTLKEKLLSRCIEQSGPLLTPCLVWQGATLGDGHGQIVWDGQVIGTHRARWLCEHGSIPTGMHILHRCDNPPCVAYDHLFCGTHQDNMADKIAKGRANIVYGEHQGSAKLTESEVIQIRSLYATNQYSQRWLASEFGVTQGAVWRIIHRKDWRHVL